MAATCLLLRSVLGWGQTAGRWALACGPQARDKTAVVLAYEPTFKARFQTPGGSREQLEGRSIRVHMHVYVHM